MIIRMMADQLFLVLYFFILMENVREILNIKWSALMCRYISVMCDNDQ